MVGSPDVLSFIFHCLTCLTIMKFAPNLNRDYDFIVAKHKELFQVGKTIMCNDLPHVIFQEKSQLILGTEITLIGTVAATVAIGAVWSTEFCGGDQFVQSKTVFSITTPDDRPSDLPDYGEGLQVQIAQAASGTSSIISINTNGENSTDKIFKYWG